jgi:pyruvate formate lyase activating enzyme
MIKDAILYNKFADKKVECIACARRCKIPEGSKGFCFVRQNISGKLKLVTYGIASAVQLDPIEKKPFNHFHPGSYVFGIGTSSCNWGCSFCQNHNISKEKEIAGVELSPKRIVEMALENSAQGIAFTYNEPTIFMEYALDTARIAHKHGLYNLFVTNGFMTKEAVGQMKGLIDAAVVNFKGNAEQKFTNKYETVFSSEPIKEAILAMKEAGIHLEFTDLIIPDVGESLEACDDLTKWVFKNVGPDAPIQFTRFHPDYKMLDSIPTPYGTLKKHYEIAKKNGLRYVYIGNVPGTTKGNTYCPECNSLAIERDGFSITKWLLNAENGCKKCGNRIPIAGKVSKTLKYREIVSLY